MMIRRPSGLRKKEYRTRKGMALVMAIVLVPVLLFLAASFVNPIVRSYRAAVADQKALLAKNVAESFFEEAMWESREAGVGELTEGCVGDCQDGVDYGFGTATGRWKVMGTPETDPENLISVAGNNYYTIPSPGSGDAGGDYCSTKEPVVSDGALDDKQNELSVSPPPLTGQDDVLSWPCHWNKLYEGDSVTIPLYVESGGVVLNPTDLQLDEFELIIRPPCKPEDADNSGRDDPYLDEICMDSERYQLFGEPDKFDREVVIVLWEITGKDKNTGDNVVIQPYLLPANYDFDSNFTVRSINNFNTASGMPYTMNQASFATDNPSNPLDYDNLTNYLQDMDRPVLRLIAIHTLRDTASNPPQIIPYLEYQFKSPDISVSPVSSTSKVVRVDVMIDGGYSETIERSIALPKPVSGFVIQQ